MANNMQEADYVSYIEDAMKKTLRKGANEIEAFYSKANNLNVRIEKNEIINEKQQKTHGVGFRTIKNRAMGYSYTNQFESHIILETASKSLDIAKISQSYDFWEGLPTPKKLPPVKEIYDPKISNISAEEAVELALVMLNTVREDKRVQVDTGSVHIMDVETILLNSNDIFYEEKSTYIVLLLMCFARTDEDIGSFAFDYEASRKYNIDPVELAIRIKDLTIRGLGAKEPESRECEILLDPNATREILGTISYGINSENIQKKSSPFEGKIGQKVASELLSIEDHGVIDGGLNSTSFDGEGTPPQRTKILTKGELKAYTYNCFTAFREGKESTGHASRASYLTPPRVGVTNLIVGLGSKTKEELIDEIDYGIYIGRISGNFRPQNGMISGTIKQGFLIEHGEITTPLIGTMVSGNTLDWMKNVTGIGKEPKKTFIGPIPPLRIEGVKIIGRK